MIYILLSVLFSSFVVLVFKWCENYKLPLWPVISINYLVCSICGAAGLLIAGEQLIPDSIPTSLLILLLVQGIIFISTFYFIGRTTQEMGVSVSMVSAKMSVLMPVLFSVFYYGEEINFILVAGILCSLVAVWLVSRKNGESKSKKGLLMPVLVFLGSGVVDTLMKIIETEHLSDFPLAFILSFIFAVAGIVGLIREFATKTRFTKEVILGGIGLGIPNYFSMFFLLKMLHVPSLPASLALPVNNVGIVLVSTLAAYLIFSEKLSKLNMAGLLLAVISIVLFALSHG